MKNSSGLALTLVLFFAAVPARADFVPLYFDFGPSGSPTTGGPPYYNNVTTAGTGNKIANAIDAENVSTGISLAVTNNFYGEIANGVNSTLAGFTSDAQRDNLYVRTVTGSDTRDVGEVRLGNLNPNLFYDIVLFGSRTDDRATTPDMTERYTVYTIDGVEQVLDTRGNTSEVVTFAGVAPQNVSGSYVIDINVRLLTDNDTDLLSQLGIAATDTDHAYLSAMRVTPVPEPGTLALLLVPAACLAVRRRRKR